MKSIASRAAGLLLAACSGFALAATPLLLPAPQSGAVGSRTLDQVGASGVAVRFNAKGLAAAPAGSELELTLPNDSRHAYVLDFVESHGDGITSWIARHRDLGIKYRAIVTNGPTGSFAVFSTPEGEYRLIPGGGNDWLVASSTLPAEPVDLGNDARLEPKDLQKRVDTSADATTFNAIAGVNVISSGKVTPSPQAVVDLMIVYTNGLAANLGSNLMTRFNFLVTRANTAYADSDVAITLRLVRTVPVTYTDAGDNGISLDAISPGRPGFDAATFGGIEALRTAAGADMVALLRNGSSFGGSGIAWVGQQAPFLNPLRMYSVTTGCVQGCESVFIHELGHNMGNMHDRHTVAWQGGGDPVGSIDQGAFPYSYGYAFCNTGLLSCNPNLAPGSGGCAAGTQPECSTNHANNFSDLMAYFHGTTFSTYKFSNPLVNCVATGGDLVPRPCGVNEAAANSANTALSMNNMRIALSGIKPTGAGALQFTAAAYTAAEGSNMNFVVRRVGGPAGAVSVQYATANGTATAGLDYPAVSGTLNWADGDSADKTISIPILSDNAPENGEAFTVTLSNPGGAVGVSLGTPTVASGLIPGNFPSGTLGGLPNSPAGWSTPAASSVPWAIVNDSAPVGDADGLSLKSGALDFVPPPAFGCTDPTYGAVPCPSMIDFAGTFSAGTIAFSYKVNSFPGNGFFEFFIDGVLQQSASGPDTPPNPDSGWQVFSAPITAGAHTLRWQYRPRFSFPCANASSGGPPPYPNCVDRAWIDQVNLPVNLAASTTAVVSSVNPSAAGQSVTFTATVSGASGTPTGALTFRNGGVDIGGCVAIALTAGAAQCTTSGLPPGANSIVGTYSGNSTYNTSSSTPLVQTVNLGPQLFTASPATLAFGGQSMNTTSTSLTSTITNTAGASRTITGIAATTGYTVTHNCPTTPMAPLATCTVTVTFTPPVGVATGPHNGVVSIVYAGGGPTVVNLTGTAERSLVSHYYRSILRRAPDAGGKTYWESEATRVAGLGANINETWFAMAQAFYFSAEYAAFNRDSTGYITDLYNTFFNRAPDAGGLAFWIGQLTTGLPREVALASFMFSTEFGNFTTAIFGNAAVRAEVNTVVDFYRGLLARTPDDGGFNFWVGRFRTAQCQNAAAVTAQVEAISSAYTLSAEYLARNRTNAQYIGDLYNAFLRRGGDLGGVQFWIGQVGGAQTREQVRVQFRNSPEFQARVAAIIAQGCITP